MHILLADDDITVCDIVRRYLQRDGFEVTVATTGPQASAALSAGGVDLAVLDVMMPTIDGLSLCRQIRSSPHADLPVIFLSALAEEDDRIAGFEAGADDYLTKPFSPRELALRVASVLRRAGSSNSVDGQLHSGGLSVDPGARTAVLDGGELSLTSREFELLVFFLTHPNTVFSREELLKSVWQWDFGDLSTVTVHVKRLRAKLGASHPIETVWGHGYRWADA